MSPQMASAREQQRRGLGAIRAGESVVISRHILFVSLHTFVSSCDVVRVGGNLESGEEGGR